MISKNSHILFITPGFAINETDTVAMPYLQVYFKALLTQGFKISIVTFHHPATSIIHKWNNCDVYSMGKYAKWLKPLLWIKAINAIIKINKKELITTIHSFWLGDCALVGHWARYRVEVMVCCSGDMMALPMVGSMAAMMTSATVR